jgi:TctA family transporter
MADLSLIDLFGYFFQGLAALFTVKTFLALTFGVFMGFWVGILPGVGGPATLAILIPFTFTLDPFTAFALLLGMISVATTAGDITAILFGIPGESANAAIVEDGSPMAKRGEAGRALGAVLMSSLLGAIIGAFCLALGIALVRPLVLSVGYAEFFMLSLAGIAFLASLSAKAVVKGLAAGALGLLLATIGMSAVTGIERFTFGSLFLWDGLGFLPAVLGLFAVPELIDMAKGTSRLAKPGESHIAGVRQGVRDSFRNIGLVFRCSVLGTYIGLIPGMGASIAQWVAYGHAVQNVEDKSLIGKGAVEGVIGPGAATNATMSGSLIPTIGFGVPGSPQMAILLGAFIVQGLVPGPSMLTPESGGGHLTLAFSMVWMIILANVIVVAVSFMFLRHIAKVAYIDPQILFPFVLVLIFVGSFANKNDLLDFWVCFGFGILGWAMVQLKWPRPPLILGLVLGALIEDNLFLTVQAYGMTWLGFPSVILIFVVILASLSWPYLKIYLARRRVNRAVLLLEPDLTDVPHSEADHPGPLGDVLLSAGLALVFASALLTSMDWQFSAALMPMSVATAGLAFAVGQGIISVRSLQATGWSNSDRFDSGIGEKRAALTVCVAFLLFFLLVVLLGFTYAVAISLLGYLVRYSQLGMWPAFALAIGGAGALYLGFDYLLQIPFTVGYLAPVLPRL